MGPQSSMRAVNGAVGLDQVDLNRRGQAYLRCQQVAGKTAVTSSYATTPIKLLTPRPRGLSVWSCTSSFGGGVVAGDETTVELDIRPRARCFLSTQASTKIYKNPESKPCSHSLRAEVAEEGLLVLAPDVVQCFAGASYTQRQQVILHPTAGLVLLDACSSGRVAREERWAFTRYSSRIEILERTVSLPTTSPRLEGSDASFNPSKKQSTRVRFLDSLRLEQAEGSLDDPMRLGRFNCIALLLLLGPALATYSSRLLESVAERPASRRGDLLVSSSPLRGGALLRVAGERFEDVSLEIHGYLRFLPELLGDDPFARKW